MSRARLAAERWAVALAGGLRPADIDARREAVIGPERYRRCGVALPRMPRLATCLI